MSENLCLDNNFSTTRLVTESEPAIINNPDDRLDSFLFLPTNDKREGEGGLRTKGYFKKSHKEKPLISIITVVYNGEKHLEQTIKSVIEQSYDNVEYIIVDGGSNDSTLDIIKKYEDKIDYWVSEEDEGIYHAMNKGITLASGDIIGLINADDYYEDNIFEEIVSTYEKNKCDLIFGDCTTITLQGDMKINRAMPQCKKYTFLPCSLSWIWFGMLFNHPASFISMDWYKKYGLFDDSYKIAGDYELLLRLYRSGGTFSQIKKNLAYFREGGISTSLEYSTLLYNEKKKILRDANYVIGNLSIFIKKLMLLRYRVLGRKS
jgi:glycosyltransferase involved in cell wall biosynthesis